MFIIKLSIGLRRSPPAEDNNTRVLFERVLSSGQLHNEDTVGLWNRFLEFECNVGDLASIVKVGECSTLWLFLS